MAAYSDIWYPSADGRLRLYARDYGGSGVPVLCLHGLTRNSADFDSIACHLSSRYRIISVDQRGRGKSEWDDVPLNYNPAIYVQDMFRLMAELSLMRVAVIGTSLGGLMAMIMGSMAPQAIMGMVINDVGPELDPVGLKRIAGYTGKGVVVSSWAEAAARAREVNGVAFPDYGEDDWLAFAQRTYETRPDGSIAPAYDPAIAQAFAPVEGAPAMDLWPMWDALEALPILAVRGELSDLLSPETFANMCVRHTGMKAVTVARVGHAPMLDEPQAVAAIEDFLKGLTP